MENALTPPIRVLGNVWKRWMRWWIDEVPDDLARCQFDCEKINNCSKTEWESCQLRLDYVAMLQESRKIQA
ncbi:hypothetical protein [uncultured Thiocystis sp.]|jgi:hypothetical protein|uniref:hypothetical protein n=1 Tax=uncultured Thiocystis sp. TaxID=1202134 RepID=UPI0025D07D84|nr:hypothetical protein [uncultured Thiocystis sp.]